MSATATELGLLVERRRAEDALRENEARFRTLAESLSDALVIVDARGTIVFLNPAAEQIFGHRRADLIGEDLTMLIPHSMRNGRRRATAGLDLTPHETRVLRLFVNGHNYKSAAAALGVSVHTISFHLRRIYDKLQVHSKTEAVARALQHGLV